jgi:hypothetical protein
VGFMNPPSYDVIGIKQYCGGQGLWSGLWGTGVSGRFAVQVKRNPKGKSCVVFCGCVAFVEITVLTIMV